MFKLKSNYMQFIKFFLCIFVWTSFNINKDLQSIDINKDTILYTAGITSYSMFYILNSLQCLKEYYSYRKMSDNEFYKCSHGSKISKRELLFNINFHLFSLLPFTVFGINSDLLLNISFSFKKTFGILGILLSTITTTVSLIEFCSAYKFYNYLKKNNLNEEQYNDGSSIHKDCVLYHLKYNLLSFFYNSLNGYISYRLLKKI